MKRLNKFLLVGGIAVIFSLTQCDLITTEVSKLIFPPKVIDFPAGEHKEFSYSITSWIDKPYSASLNIGFQHSEQAFGNDNYLRSIPFHFSIFCYRLEKGRNILIYQKTVISKDIRGGNGWNIKNSKYPNAFGWSKGMGIGFRLPAGNYRCDFKDISHPDIKRYLETAGIFRTAIDISPYKQFIY